MESTFTVRHLDYLSRHSFEETVAKLEAATGDIADGILARELKEAVDAEDFQRRMQSYEGSSGFMRFLVLDHGALLTLFGHATKARFYSIGNPLLALTMLRHDVGAALNVPVRFLIIETAEGEVHLSYDLPSSLMSQVGNEALTAAAQKLDAKVAQLAENVTGADQTQ